MRLWSLHPEYLDSKGLVALWREALLAKHVLEGKTKGYKNHPQLERFKNSERPTDAINEYLATVFKVSVGKGYRFDKLKINWDFIPSFIPVSDGQLNYELEHLLGKLKIRDKKKYKELKNIRKPRAHPIFRIRRGEVEEWEKQKKASPPEKGRDA